MDYENTENNYVDHIPGLFCSEVDVMVWNQLRS